MNTIEFFRNAKLSLMLGLMFLMVGFVSCGDDDTDPDPDPDPVEEVVADFGFTANVTEVDFINASENATDYSWDFGDGNTSTEENPSHTYESPGEYQVTLTASNSEFSDSKTETVTTQNGGPLASKIAGKEWIPAHGEVFCYMQGPFTSAGTETFNDQGGDDANFGWGDFEPGWGALLNVRPGLANDVYTFNADGTMSVNFNGDLWAEFSLWGEENETSLVIADGIPTNSDGEDMSAFANPNDDWTFVIDEENATITCNGQGAHILNPRMAYSSSGNTVLTPVSSVWYDIVRVVEVEGAADTLVIYAEVNDLQFGHYITLHAYESPEDIPERKPIPETKPQFDLSVPSTSLNHGFTAETDAGSGIWSIDGPYTVEYGVTIGDATCTKMTRPIGDQWGNYFIRAGTAPNAEDRKEIDFSGGETVVSLDVYMPSSNDYTAEIQNIVRIRFFDESRLQGNFWQEYIELAESDLPLDQWVTLTFDFTTLLADAAAQDTPNIPDGVFIEFGEVGTITTSESSVYVKDFKFIAP